jgi:hypothetical protein
MSTSALYTSAIALGRALASRLGCQAVMHQPGQDRARQDAGLAPKQARNTPRRVTPHRYADAITKGSICTTPLILLLRIGMVPVVGLEPTRRVLRRNLSQMAETCHICTGLTALHVVGYRCSIYGYCSQDSSQPKLALLLHRSKRQAPDQIHPHPQQAGSGTHVRQDPER